jgi:DNA-binding Xre family transcriptional regulator
MALIISKIKELMDEKKMTYAILEKATGLTNQTISRARDGRIGTCTLNTLATIAAALGVPVKDLFEEG